MDLAFALVLLVLGIVFFILYFVFEASKSEEETIDIIGLVFCMLSAIFLAMGSMAVFLLAQTDSDYLVYGYAGLILMFFPIIFALIKGLGMFGDQGDV